MGLYSDYIFPKYFDCVIRLMGLEERRAEVLQGVEGKILEIGIGTGINLDYYPKHVKEITAIDPNPGMEKQLKAKLKEKSIKVNFVSAMAENLPFESASFHTVVSTITLCSLPHLQKALSEIGRVLGPEGKFIFLEHGLSHDAGIARLQRFLNPVQNFIGSGCKLTVDVEKELLQAGFQILSLKMDYVPRAPKILGYIYQGVAVKKSDPH